MKTMQLGPLLPNMQLDNWGEWAYDKFARKSESPSQEIVRNAAVCYVENMQKVFEYDDTAMSLVRRDER